MTARPLAPATSAAMCITSTSARSAIWPKITRPRLVSAKQLIAVPAQCAGAHTRCMGRIIGTILGVILAIWLAFTAIGWITATLKTFLITALIAAIVITVVSLLAKLSGSD